MNGGVRTRSFDGSEFLDTEQLKASRRSPTNGTVPIGP